MKTLTRFGFLFLGLAAAACGKSSAPSTDATAGTQAGAAPASFVGSCNKVNKTSKCDEYASTTLSLEEDMCKEIGGTYSATAACPTEARLGACKKASGMTYYYATKLDINYTAAQAKEDCEDELTHGKWTPAPGANAQAPVTPPANAPAHANAADSKKPSTKKAGH